MRQNHLKKYIGTAVICIMTAGMAVSGCGKKTQDQTEQPVQTEQTEDTKQSENTEQVEQTEEPEQNASSGVIMPLNAMESIIDTLPDGEYAAHFEAKDFAETADGYELTVEIGAYDTYAPEDIENLKAGDKIQVCQNEVTVDTVEVNDSYVSINGGIEQDGVDLIRDNDIYRTFSMDDQPMYYTVGTITIPVDTECTLEDHSDYDKEPDGVVYEYDQLKEMIANSDTAFYFGNTSITVRQGKIAQIVRIWTP
ncbi:MAG: hypothetical protein SOR88_01005 [Roseburia inulinivorans]|nr:hypothetical protein [Roseburia inulinivorans]